MVLQSFLNLRNGLVLRMGKVLVRLVGMVMVKGVGHPMCVRMSMSMRSLMVMIRQLAGARGSWRKVGLVDLRGVGSIPRMTRVGAQTPERICNGGSWVRVGYMGKHQVNGEGI